MSHNDVLAAISAVGAAVAAVAGVMAVRRAKTAIEDARKAQQQNSDAHREDTRQQTALLEATHKAHQEEIEQQAALLATQHEQHTEGLIERGRVFEAERAEKRLDQLGVIADLLREIGDTARLEWSQSASGISNMSPIAAIATRIDVAVTIYVALGAAPPADLVEFARTAAHINKDRVVIMSEAVTQLTKMQTLISAEADALNA